MPFNGGGGGQTQPHEHTAIANDGGPLDFNNTTIGSMAAGDITYSDGNALQILNAPGVPAGEVLTFAPAATAPSWSTSASAGSLQLVDHTVLGAAATEIDTSFTAISGDDISYMVAFVTGIASDAVRAEINGVTVSYYSQGQSISGGVQTLINESNVSDLPITVSGGGGETFAGIIYFSCGNTSMAATPRSLTWTSFGTADHAPSLWAQGNTANAAGAQASLSRFRIFPNSGNLEAGTSLTLYRMNAT